MKLIARISKVVRLKFGRIDGKIMAAVGRTQVPNHIAEGNWPLTARIVFRACVIYFSLYCLTTQILGGLVPIPGFDFPDPSSFWPWRPLVFWTAAHLFHTRGPLVYTGSGSGDKTFDWVLSFCLLVIAAAGTILWSVLDRKRRNYDRLNRYCRLLLRFAVAGQMFTYGIVKLIPLQMPFPYLSRLVEPFGDFSPMGVLWSSVGAMPAYEMFVGSAELLAGVLLIVPRTSMLGALVCLVDAIEIFVLNMTYDVPVKLFSFHLILMSLILLAPEFRRLTNFLVFNRAVPETAVSELFKTRRANKIALAAQLIFGLTLITADLAGARTAWKQYGGGREKSPLYGIWNVDQMAINGRLRSPLLTDYGRWRRIIFDFPNFSSFERMNGSVAYYNTALDSKGQTLTLIQRGKQWKGNLRVARPAPDRLVLEGSMGEDHMRLEMTRLDLNKFPLVSRGFHWIQEYPFNR